MPRLAILASSTRSCPYSMGRVKKPFRCYRMRSSSRTPRTRQFLLVVFTRLSASGDLIADFSAISMDNVIPRDWEKSQHETFGPDTPMSLPKQAISSGESLQNASITSMPAIADNRQSPQCLVKDFALLCRSRLNSDGYLFTTGTTYFACKSQVHVRHLALRT